jgi:hypothetical protein
MSHGEVGLGDKPASDGQNMPEIYLVFDMRKGAKVLAVDPGAEEVDVAEVSQAEAGEERPFDYYVRVLARG